MADRDALGLIGALLGIATLAVAMIGTFVVTDHLNGRLTLDDGVHLVAAVQPAR
jgi:hypothetical protein